MRRRALAATIALLASRQVAAQDVGFPPFGSFEDGQFDSINRENLNAHFEIPLVSVPGRGLDFSAALLNDSLIWRRSGNLWVPRVDATGTPIIGWNADVMGGSTSHVTETVECGKPGIGFRHSGYVFTDPAGTRHSFPLDFYSNLNCGPTGPRTAAALDDSGYYLDATAPNSPVVYDLSGRQYGSAGTVTDTNGNYVSKVVVSATETHWIDTAGRVVLKILSSANWTDYQYQDTMGAYHTIRVNLTTRTVRTNFGCPGVVEFYQSGVQLPSSIVLPNGQSYAFTYELVPGSISDTTGRIERVTLPTGGYYEYTYTGPNGGINCSDGKVNSMIRRINDGSSTALWYFERSYDPLENEWTTSVVAPPLPYDSDNDTSQFTFDSATREIARRQYEGSNLGAPPLLTVATSYPSESRTPVFQWTTLADGRQSVTSTSYDEYSLPTQVLESGWGQGAPPQSFSRRTDIGYLRTAPYTSRRILTRVSSYVVNDRPGSAWVPVYRSSTSYDEGSLTCINGASHHDDSAYGCSMLTRGNATSTTEYSDPVAPSGTITKAFTFDSLGNMRTAQVDCCRQKSWSYSAATQYAYPDTETRGATGGPQLTTAAAYNSATGLLIEVEDENSESTTYSYDSMKRLLSASRPDGAQWTITYTDSAPYASAVTAPVASGTGRRTVSAVDGLGRTTRKTLTNATATTTYSIVDTQFDALGRVYRVSNPHTSVPQYWTENRFDAIGRLKLVIPPDGSASANHISFSYSGVAVTRTDQAGHQRRLDYDAWGRLSKVTEPDPATGLLTWDTLYTYDGLDQLRTVTQGVQSRTFVYDGLGRLTSAMTPESGTDLYQYNSFGQVTQRTDARGVVTTYAYDTLNRPMQVSYNVGGTEVPSTAPVGFTYGTSSASNNNGRLITMTDGTGQETYAYDDVGRITQVSKVLAGTTYLIGYAYNFADQLTTITYPSGRQVQHSYDAIGRPAGIQFDGSSYASDFSYNAAQRPTGFNLGNGVAAALAYSPDRLQLASLSYTKPGVTLPSFSYGYAHQNGGNNGQITQVVDNASSGRTISYSYDALDRLLTAESVGSASYSKWKLAWTYDRYGNRLAQTAETGTPPSTSLLISSATNRITSPGYAYDVSGNMTELPGATLAVDAEGRLVTHASGSAGAYAYDGRGIRVRSSVSSGTDTLYVFSGAKLLAQYGMDGGTGATPATPLREYVYAGNTLLATTAGGSRYHLTDHLSVRAISDDSGVVDSGHYPFGEQWYATSGENRWLFTSYERDTESNFDYAITRFKPAWLDRFARPDALAGFSSHPQTLNRYVYTSNDPVNNTDPLGLTTSNWNSNCTPGWDCVWGDAPPIPPPPRNRTGTSYLVLVDGIAWGAPPPGTPRPGGGGPSGPVSPIAPVTPCKVTQLPNTGNHGLSIDIRAAYGTPVVAPENGTVIDGNKVGTYFPYPGPPAPPGRTNFIDFRTDTGFVVRFVHAHPTVPVPSSAKAGDSVGETDKTGRLTGPHLHVQVKDPTGARINPMTYYTNCKP